MGETAVSTKQQPKFWVCNFWHSKLCRHILYNPLYPLALRLLCSQLQSSMSLLYDMPAGLPVLEALTFSQDLPILEGPGGGPSNTGGSSSDGSGWGECGGGTASSTMRPSPLPTFGAKVGAPTLRRRAPCGEVGAVPPSGVEHHVEVGTHSGTIENNDLKL